MTQEPSGFENPLDEIRRAERAAAAARESAKVAAEHAITEARRRADKLILEARNRGEVTAAKHYEEAMTRAHDAALSLESIADDRIAAMRLKADPHLDAAVDAVVAFVLPQEGD